VSSSIADSLASPCSFSTDVGRCLGDAFWEAGSALAMLQRAARRGGHHRPQEAAPRFSPSFKGRRALFGSHRQATAPRRHGTGRNHSQSPPSNTSSSGPSRALLQAARARKPRPSSRLGSGTAMTGVSSATRKLLPTLIASSVASTLLVFILLLCHHQRYRDWIVVPKNVADPAAEGEDGGDIPTAASVETLKPSNVSPRPGLGRSDQERAEAILCTSLVVPKGKRMVCLVESRLRREPQDTEFRITSSQSRGCKPLMLVRVQEVQDTDTPKIVLEQLPDSEDESGEVFASVSTADLWEDESNHQVEFTFFDASGEVFGQFGKTSSDTYNLARVQDDSEPCLAFFGDFREHSVRVESCHDSRLVATVEACRRSNLRDMYQVSIEPNADAGLVLLGLLTIDKNEGYTHAMDRTGGFVATSTLLFGSFLGNPAENLTELDATRD